MPEINQTNERRPGLVMSVGAVSVVGKVRDENQDRMSRSLVPQGDLYIVADGMGGYKGGATAAQITVETIERFFQGTAGTADPRASIRAAIQQANAEVNRRAESGDPECHRMGSTAVVLLVADGAAHVGYVGDSRAYLFHKGQLTQLSSDHTKVQEMVNGGILSPEEARDHPDTSTLTRVLGPKPEVEVDLASPVKLEEGDAILLCSDGLSGYVTDDLIVKAISQTARVQKIADNLIDLAMKAGGEDNITVQFARYGTREEPIAPPVPKPRPRRGLGMLAVGLVVAASGVAVYLGSGAWKAGGTPPLVVDGTRPVEPSSAPASVPPPQAIPPGGGIRAADPSPPDSAARIEMNRITDRVTALEAQIARLQGLVDGLTKQGKNGNAAPSLPQKAAPKTQGPEKKGEVKKGEPKSGEEQKKVEELKKGEEPKKDEEQKKDG